MKAVLLEPLRLDLPPLAGLSRSGCAPVPPCHVQGLGFRLEYQRGFYCI